MSVQTQEAEGRDGFVRGWKKFGPIKSKRATRESTSPPSATLPGETSANFLRLRRGNDPGSDDDDGVSRRGNPADESVPRRRCFAMQTD